MSLPHVERTFKRGERVYALDDPATQIYATISGRIKIVRASASGQCKITSICYCGDIFGELALERSAVEPRRSDEAVALDLSRIAIVRVEDFWRAKLCDPAVMQDLVRFLTTRLAEAQRQIESLVFDDNQHRLARVLLDLSREASRAGETSLRLIHEELAELIGSSREVVTSLMIEFRSRGLIEYTRGEIHLRLPQLVQFLAGASRR
jgi:CRP/FNR family transcriptional regulator